MKMEFDGKILVSSAVMGEKSYLILEVGKGSGVPGSFTTDPSRLGGSVVDIDDIGKSENTVVLEFCQPQSIVVILESLQCCLMHQLKILNGKTQEIDKR